MHRLAVLVSVLVFAAALGRPNEVRAGACAPTGDLETESPYVTEGAMPADGALLWVLPSATYRGAPPPGTSLRGPADAHITLVEEMLAPNLRVRRPASALSTGAWELEGAARTITVDAALPANALPAPSLRFIRWTGGGRVRDRSGWTVSEGWVEGRVRTHAPGAIGLVISEGADARPVVFIAATESPFTVYQSSGRCSPTIGVRIERGTRVTARFVDAWGRLSPPSRPVVVR